MNLVIFFSLASEKQGCIGNPIGKVGQPLSRDMVSLTVSLKLSWKILLHTLGD